LNYGAAVATALVAFAVQGNIIRLLQVLILRKQSTTAPFAHTTLCVQAAVDVVLKVVKAHADSLVLQPTAAPLLPVQPAE
jgi:hypothetical protein